MVLMHVPARFGDGASADDGKLGTKLYHGVNMVVLAGVPAAVATSPSALTMPLDIVLGIALPLHAHIGMNYGEPTLCGVCVSFSIRVCLSVCLSESSLSPLARSL